MESDTNQEDGVLTFDRPFSDTLDKFQSPFTLSSQSTPSKENFALCLTFLTLQEPANDVVPCNTFETSSG